MLQKLNKETNYHHKDIIEKRNYSLKRVFHFKYLIYLS